MHNSHSRNLLTALKLGVGFNAMIMVSGAAFSQETEPPEARLQTVTVTATKRPQTLQDIPIAVSVVGDVEIQRAEIQDVFDLQSVVPSLTVSQSTTTGNSGFSIRGFGGVASNAGIEPSVGVFIDGVYRSRASAQISDLIAVERVEVLRGPQSAIFGKNASVGAVSILTKEPEFDFGGSASVTYGNFDTVRLRGDITGPITDNLAYRIGGTYNRRDGYADNLATGGDFSDRDRWSIQGQLLFTPTDDLSIRLIGDYDEIDETCCFQGNLIAGPVTAAVLPAIGADVVLEDPFSFTAFNDAEPVNEIQNGGFSLHVTKGFANFADVTSITAFRVSDTLQITDGDTSSADISVSLNELNTDTFTQEIRLTSNNQDSRFDWLVGAFYFNEDLDFPGSFVFGEDFRPFVDAISGGAVGGVEGALGLPVGLTFFQDGQGTFEERGQENTTWSLFANVDLHITDRLTATGGISYINDEKEAFLTQVNTDAFSSLDFVALGFGAVLGGLGVDTDDPAAVAAFAAANPATFAAIQAGVQDPAINTLLGLQALQFFPPFLNFPNEVEDGRTSDDDVTYTARLSYDATDWLNVYGSYATGFKASAINLSNASRPSPQDFIPGSPVTNPPPSAIRDAGLDVPNLTTGSRFAGPEETEVFEIGAKLRLSNLFVGLTLFDQTVDGFQSNTFNGLGFELANAGSQTTRGIEIDTQWAVTSDFTVSFFGAFYDAEFDEFTNSPFGDLTGERPAGIPAVSTNLSANYNFTLFNLDGFIRGDWQYSGPAAFSDDPDVQALIGFEEDSNLVNLSAGLTLPTGTELTVWGRNIFDEQFVVGAFPAIGQAGSITALPNQPATYGFTLRQNF
ncbi:MAG: TonB-dependent receptor [Pseudomonadota bacterium]